MTEKPGIDINTAVKIIEANECEHRGQAFKALRKNNIETTPEVFNQIMDAYTKKNQGLILPKSPRAISSEKMREISYEVHNMSSEEAKEHLINNKEPDQKSWKIFALFKDGKWHNEIKAEDFETMMKNTQYKETAVQQKNYIENMVNKAVDHLMNEAKEEITDRGMAYKELTNADNKELSRKMLENSRQSKTIFQKAIERYNEIQGKTLEVSPAAKNREALSIRAHNMTIDEIQKEASGLEMPNDLMYKIRRIAKEGKFKGTGFNVNNLKCFINLYNRKAQQAQQQKTNEIEI